MTFYRKGITLFARRFGFRTNQTLVDKTDTDQNAEQPQYEEITTGHVNQAGPSGTDGIVGEVTSPYINVPASGRTETETDVTSDPSKQYQPLNVM